MTTRDKVVLGALAGAGALWGTRAWLRSRRRIELADRVVIVTGSSSGLGLLVARHAAARGARVVLVARDADALGRAEPELMAEGARDVLSVPTDVTDPGQVERMVERALERFGRIDVLVNNAGIITVGPMEAMTLDDYRRVMETNFWGEVYPTLAVLPHMRDRQFGRIANVVSLGGKFAMPHLLPYTASKFALTGLTEGLRAELARDNILVTGIYPSTIRTGGFTHAWFKGDHQGEYAWFALGDTVPLLSTSADYAAGRLWDAVCHGDPEVIVGWQARAAIAMNHAFPDLTAELMALVNRLLPPPTNLGAPAVRGEDLRGTVPGLLNRLVPSAARPGGG